jgi:hypothetical protein
MYRISYSQRAQETGPIAVKAMPDGSHRVTPYLVVPGVATRLDFLTQAFEAHELHRLPRPDGIIMPAEVRMGDSRVMLGEPRSEAPPLLGTLSLDVHDVDAVYTRAARGCDLDECARGPVLWRPQRWSHGPGRQPVVARHALGRRLARGDRHACRGLHAAAALRRRPLSPVAVPDRSGCHPPGRGSWWWLRCVDHWHAPACFPMAARGRSTPLGYSPACGPLYQVIHI